MDKKFTKRTLEVIVQRFNRQYPSTPVTLTAHDNGENFTIQSHQQWLSGVMVQDVASAAALLNLSFGVYANELGLYIIIS